MAVTIIGTSAVTKVQYGESVEASGRSGQTEVWRGPVAAADAKYVALVAALGASNVSISRDHGVGVVSVNEATEPEDLTWDEHGVWEILGQSEQRDIDTFTGWKDLADTNFANDTDAAIKSAIMHARQAAERGDWNYLPTNATALRDWKLRRHGVSAYLASRPVLQVSLVVSKTSTIVTPWLGVDQAWKLDGETGSPNPPDWVVTDVSKWPLYDADVKQWLYSTPQVRQVDSRHRQLVRQWIGAAEWSETLYRGSWLP